MSGKAVNNILIVGGGTAGWLTANYLATRLGAHEDDGPDITLVESEQVGTIMVGEGTFPTILRTMSTIGIDEAKFIRECSGTFKQGIKFVDWQHAPEDGRHSHYYHPFDAPEKVGPLDLTPYWCMGLAEGDTSFADAVTFQEKVCEAGFGPKLPGDKNYQGPMTYAYHLNAGKFAKLLRDEGISNGVKHLVGHVTDVNLDEAGAIKSVTTKEQGDLEADFFVDCTGFASLLIGKALGVPFHNINDTLFVDRAITIQVPYDDPLAPIPCQTISTAHEAGWTWDIGLHERRGIGYVYSSKYSDETRAEEVLRNYIGPGAKDLTSRSLKMNIGYRDKQWAKNCVAVGLSGGFLEPLEATGIFLIELAVTLLGAIFPRNGEFEEVSELFNKTMAGRYDSVIEFIKMHYFLTKRTDNDFWIDNARPETAPDSLLEKLALWKYRPPSELDFTNEHGVFKYFSYQYILYGMGFKTDLSKNASAYPLKEDSKLMFQQLQTAADRARSELSSHRNIVNSICAAATAKPSPGVSFQTGNIGTSVSMPPIKFKY